MAQITLGPLSIGGFQAPLNLLGGLLTTNNPTNLIYPLDLATNPIYGHAVQFTVYEYISPLSNLSNQIGNQSNNLANSIASASAGQKLTTAEDFVSNTIGPVSLSNVEPVAKQLFSGNLASKFRTEQSLPLATISLYMPDSSLTTSFDSHYTELSMTDTLGFAGYLTSAISDIIKNKGSTADLTKVIGPYAKQLSIDALSKLGHNPDELKSALQQALGQIPNPQMQMVYKGIGLRSFQLQFVFTPISSQEAQQVDQIINAFTYYSVPQLISKDQSGQFLTPPQIFKIKFAFTGNPSLLGSIGNVFKNTLTNVFGSQLSGTLLGSNASSTISAAPNAKIFSVGDCVLENVTVDYAPNGWAAHNDGYPIQTTLSLQFKEMDIVTKDKITSWTGYSGPTTNQKTQSNSINPLDPQGYNVPGTNISIDS